jgi:hypothetical protein
MLVHLLLGIGIALTVAWLVLLVDESLEPTHRGP